MNGYDIDGVLGSKRVEVKQPAICISGRTFAEWDATCAEIAKAMPIYIRGTGLYGDRHDAACFKAEMIRRFGVTRFFEDDPFQADEIERRVPTCEVILVK